MCSLIKYILSTSVGHKTKVEPWKFNLTNCGIPKLDQSSWLLKRIVLCRHTPCITSILILGMWIYCCYYYSGKGTKIALKVIVMNSGVQACDNAEVFAQCLQGNFNNPHTCNSASTPALQVHWKHCYFSPCINTYQIPVYLRTYPSTN